MTDRLNTTGLIKEVAADVGMSQAEVRVVVTATFNAIMRANASGHAVAVTNFGTWLPHGVKAHTGRNPSTGGPVQVDAHQRVRFRVSPTFRSAVRDKTPQPSIRKAPQGATTGT